MKVMQLYSSDSYDFFSSIQKSQLVLPFYATHSQARESLIHQLKEGIEPVYVVVKKNQPLFFIALEEKKIINLLAIEASGVTWQQVFDGLELIYKKTFQSEAVLQFSQVLSESEDNRLVGQGYSCLGNTARKVLTYNTALVLGGGGARGAYQIGVWQALKELEIPIQIITGTSVGALNGALIVQDDFEEAKDMWEKIETKKILSFPMKDNTQNTLPDMLRQMASFTVAAIQSKGVSTEPLQQLLEDTFSQEKLAQAKQQFYLVTTELPGVVETVIHFNSCKNNQWKQWLLASSSFFPAMAAAQIDGKYYIDGGYRNNIPVDTAVANGATECIIVDVKGPGLTKHVVLPDGQSSIVLKTPWSLGTVLLFDGARSIVNIKLGYLEMMKALEKYCGYWYTFDETLSAIQAFQQQFFHYLKGKYQLSLWKNREERKKFYQKLRKYYKDRVYEENISLALLELLGKSAAILPDQLYTFSEFIDLLADQAEKQDKDTFSGMISVQEWLGKYYDDFFLLSEKKQLQLVADLLAVDVQEKQKRLQVLLEQLPVITLQVLMKEFIKEGKENKWLKNFHMKS
ncbi:patatin-like phospholipase family protein [uncultured Enterococcus sp.]|uniref:patatin-like phospholipase family protein n=1 Tax=uncultured Enterococcus sp. TaxID=167972 RepID=UPI002AA67ABC|nr:patatin-like phospholipase family protein [uncultured Enterococcus sp.]